MNPFHFYLATDGLGPGTTHYVISVLGRRINIEVTPIPPPVDTGGGGGTVWLPGDQRYLVTVKINIKGKEYVQSREVDRSGLASIEKVIATFTKASKIINDIKIEIVDLTTKVLRTIGINIKPKNRK